MDTPSHVPVSEARDHIGRLADEAFFNDDHTVLTKHGEPRAVLVPYEWWARRRRRATTA